MDPSELRDLHLPDAIGWWPLAPGWWVLVLLLAAGISWLLWRAVKKRRLNAARRFALRELAEVESRYRQHKNPVALATQVSALLRRAMLAYAPRHEVAGLTGEAWLAWLDCGLPVPYFHTEGGKCLLQLPYRDPQSELGDVDINALLAATRMRIAIPIQGAR